MANRNAHIIDLGNIHVFRQEYEAHFTALKHFAMQYHPDEEQVCDLLQDIWMKLWEKKETYINEASFKTYLYRTVRNRMLNFIRDQKINEERLSQLSFEESEDAIINKIIESEIYALINEAFSELPDSCKRVYLESLKGASQKEIAEKLNISINTIKKHINNANHYLKKRLENILSLLLLLKGY